MSTHSSEHHGKILLGPGLPMMGHRLLLLGQVGPAISPAVSGNLLSHKSTPLETPYEELPEVCRYSDDVEEF